MKKLDTQVRSLKRSILNRKQQEVFAGFTLWEQELRKKKEEK
jgi:hypothetical protein